MWWCRLLLGEQLAKRSTNLFTNCSEVGHLKLGQFKFGLGLGCFFIGDDGFFIDGGGEENFFIGGLFNIGDDAGLIDGVYVYCVYEHDVIVRELVEPKIHTTIDYFSK